MGSTMDGKIALVTGAAAGIGRASAIAFGRRGAKVALADVDAPGSQETLRLLKDAGGDGIFVRCNVSMPGDVEAFVKEVVATYGRLDYAHNNAGIAGDIVLTADCTEENWDRTISVDLKGIWLCMKHEIRQMLAQGGGGAIVNASATAGLVGSRRSSAYAAAAHGVVGLTKSAALEYAQAGIRINAVCPGVTRTPMMQRIIGDNPQVEAQMVGRVPMARMATPEEIAEVVVWLCSDGAVFVTGHALSCDGGVVAS
jgi:NAD(P)-dependent dehydrogenase (short-subunit alcohol dehydrogenase family)